MSDPSWPAEFIPNDDLLYRWVHRQWFNPKTGEVSPSFFKNGPDPNLVTGRNGMSTDWSRYSTPEESRRRAKAPEINGVIAMVVGEVRAVPDQTVEHTPIWRHLNPNIQDNRAHTDVFGPKDDPEIKRLFSRISRIVLPVPSP